jgi:hypothetical protein
MRRVLLFATTFLPVLVRGYFAEFVADLRQLLPATDSLPPFAPPRDSQGLFEHDPTKPAMGGKGCYLQHCPLAGIRACFPGLALSRLLAMLADVQSRPVERETDYCLLHSVGEAKKQQFPQSVQMQAWIEGLRVLESNLLHWLYLPLAR